MTMTADMPGQVPWWKEPTREQWVAWIAAWLGWTLDAFDFTIFLLIMVPIAETFHVPLIEVTAVFTITLWLRLVGAVGSGWLADRIGRKAPLMISILWYSVCNLFAGLSPTFALLFLFRALLGIGMGAEWPAGAALAAATGTQHRYAFFAKHRNCTHGSRAFIRRRSKATLVILSQEFAFWCRSCTAGQAAACGGRDGTIPLTAANPCRASFRS